MKAFTDLEPSKKLAEILPTESADMVWISIEDDESFEGSYEALPKGCSLVAIDDSTTPPCWSLAALMDVLDRGILFKTPQWTCQSYIDFKAITSDYYNNPIDACYEMILKLKEKNLL